MPGQKYICFQNGELLDVDGRVETYPLGQLVFSILDIDWTSRLHAAEQLRQKLNTMPSTAERTLAAGFENPDEAVYRLAGAFINRLSERSGQTIPAYTGCSQRKM